MTNKSNIITWLLIIITSIVLVAFSYSIYLLWRPYNILDIKAPVKVLNMNKEIKAGDMLELQFTYQKHYPVLGTITDQLVNGVTVTLGSSTSNVRVTDKGEWVTSVRYVHIPNSIQPGQYYIRMVTNYDINPFRQITQSWNSEVFTITGECDTASLARIQKELIQIRKYQKIHKKTSEENNKLLKIK